VVNGVVTSNTSSSSSSSSGSVNKIGSSAADVLSGSHHSDILNGMGGDDVIYGAGGDDILTGGTGADRFVYSSINDGKDLITDFSVSQGDVLDIANILTGFDPLTDAISDFVRLTQQNNGVVLSVDANGLDGGRQYSDLALLSGQNANSINLEDWVDQGILKAS
jgi:Ca2+-binding RTX toxin-like protein